MWRGTNQDLTLESLTCRGYQGGDRSGRTRTELVIALEHGPLHALLLDMGFTNTGRATHFVTKTLSSVDSNPAEHRRYYLSMGDSDVY